jgi:hypothetical protein
MHAASGRLSALRPPLVRGWGMGRRKKNEEGERK